MRNWFYSRTCHRLPRILKAVTTVLSSGLSKSQVCLPLITVILASIQWSPLWSDKIYLIPPKGSVIFLSRPIFLLSHWNWHVIPVISFAPPPPPPTFPPQGIKNDQSLKLQYVLPGLGLSSSSKSGTPHLGLCISAIVFLSSWPVFGIFTNSWNILTASLKLWFPFFKGDR